MNISSPQSSCENAPLFLHTHASISPQSNFSGNRLHCSNWCPPPSLRGACVSQNASALCSDTLSFMWLDFTIDTGMCSTFSLCSSALMHINYLMNSGGLEVESRWKFMNGGPCVPRSTTDTSLYRRLSSVTSPRTAPFRSMQWFAMKPSPH